MNKFRNNTFSNKVMPNVNPLLQVPDFNSNNHPPKISSRISSNSSWQSNSFEGPSLASPQAVAPHGHNVLMTRENTIINMGYTQQ